MSFKSLCLLAGIGAFAAGISAFPGQAQANLIVNGGFETGDFTGWTADANSFSMYIVTSPVHSGTYAAQIAGYDFDPNTLSQTVADTSGQAYLLSFWRFQDSGGPTGLDVTWNGNNVFHEAYGSDYAGSPYTEFTAIVLGTGSDSLVFSSYQNPQFTYLDDVSLTAATPLPSTWTMLIAGFLGLGFFAYRGAKRNTTALAAA